jgi:5-formyltetrahydrofolate cyclo-ligase
MDKHSLRQKALEQRRQWTPLEIQERSEQLAMRFARIARVPDTKWVATYLAMPGEADPFAIGEHLRRSGYELAVPAYDVNQQVYRMVQYPPGSMLVRGRHGVFEPDDAVPVSADQIGMMLVPGLAFDRKGNRLGYGQGHYDQMLIRGFSRSLIKIGLVFDELLLDSIPAEDHDIKMDLVVTDQQVLHIGA